MKRIEARELGLKFYTPDKPCVNGHLSLYRTNSGACVECERTRAREWYRANRDLSKSRREIVKDSVNAKQRDRRLADPDRFRSAEHRYYRKNKAKFLSKWSERNARKINASPSWLSETDKKNIACIYEMAKRLSNCIGIQHHVDHIVPLKGDGVCGLHVPWNLAAIPARLNLKKNNSICFENVQYD